jgi:hypothetical protein
MNREQDHELLGLLIKSEAMYHFPSNSALARELGIERSTLYRIFAGSPGTKQQTLLKAEQLLLWPRGSIAAVLAHDHDWLRANFPESAYKVMQDLLAERTRVS